MNCQNQKMSYCHSAAFPVTNDYPGPAKYRTNRSTLDKSCLTVIRPASFGGDLRDCFSPKSITPGPSDYFFKTTVSIFPDRLTLTPLNRERFAREVTPGPGQYAQDQTWTRPQRRSSSSSSAKKNSTAGLATRLLSHRFRESNSAGEIYGTSTRGSTRGLSGREFEDDEYVHKRIIRKDPLFTNVVPPSVRDDVPSALILSGQPPNAKRTTQEGTSKVEQALATLEWNSAMIADKLAEILGESRLITSFVQNIREITRGRLDALQKQDGCTTECRKNVIFEKMKSLDGPFTQIETNFPLLHHNI